MSFTVSAIKAVSISVSLVASGGIATLSLFDIPELKAQPASRSLPSIRWLFSRGSHIFPQAAAISSAGFAYLAYNALPPSHRAIFRLFKLASNGWRVNGYIAAALLSISIGPWTTLAMVPTNFALIELNEQRGGSRSAKTANERGPDRQPGKLSARDSVNGEAAANQFTDLSGPQTETTQSTSKEDDRKTNELLSKFSALNYVRAVLLGAGGIVGLLTALAG